MKVKLPQSLIILAEKLSFPLYVVGGSVRDYLAGALRERPDWDICACGSEDELVATAQALGFTVKSVFRNTGTVKLSDEAHNEYEFTRFRSDKYVRGLHRPSEIYFTDDIRLDATRRDFCANAVYYEIKAARFLDPLGGIGDIQSKLLRTVAPAKKVFGEDGLRLLRLARIAAQTGFSPDGECMAGAKEHAALISDIVPERIYAELDALLHADDKAHDPNAPYRGLRILHETGVLKYVLPELAAGNQMDQRKEFHDHDVLEHSFRCVRYAPASIRWAALLHDIGKPFCMTRDGNFYLHDKEGASIACDILTRLKAPSKLRDETCALVRLHMKDYAVNMRAGRVRLELVKSYPLLEKLFALKQADYSACKDDLSPAPSVVKWQSVLEQMREEGAPLTLKELKITGADVINCGIEPKQAGHVLNELLCECALNGRLNERQRLLKRVSRFLNA